MGISEYIQKKKAMKPIRRRENISLQKPMVNLLIGEFEAEEAQSLVSLLDDRIGSSNKVNYAKLDFSVSSPKEEGRFFVLDIPEVSMPAGYGLEQRAEFGEQIQNCVEPLKNRVADYVNDLFNQVSTTAYTHKARIRLNLLVKPERMEAAALPVVIPLIKEEFSVYFPNGVLVDAYVFLDQKGYKREDSGDERKALTYLAMTELDQMAKEKIIQMPFCLSNYTSDDCLNPDCGQERMITAGLMMLVKDGASAQSRLQSEGKVDGYDDYTFIGDCGQESGSWYSLGHFKLDVAEDLIDHIAYRTLMVQMQKATENLSAKVKLSQMELTEDQIDQICTGVLTYSSFPPQIFYSMVHKSGVNVASMVNHSRGSMIQEIYGENLDLFYRLNCTQRYQRSLEELLAVKIKKIRSVLTGMYEEEGYTLADMNAATNHVLEHLETLQRQCEQMKEAERREFDYWLEERSDIGNLREVVKDTGVPRAFYQLANQYLDKRVRGLHVEIKAQVIKLYIEAVKRVARQYRMLAESVTQAVKELNQDIQFMMEEELKLKSGNCEEYYTQLVSQILKEDDSFSAFVRTINSRICSGELAGNELFEQVLTYCDGEILTDSRFERDFAVEMLKRLKNFEKFVTEEAIYDFAFETIMDNQRFYANYETFANVNQEVCFLVNPNNQFVAGTNQRMQKLKASRQLKVFFEEHFNDMDVLFMEGCFGIETLYNYLIYKNVYEKQMRAGGAYGGDN